MMPDYYVLYGELGRTRWAGAGILFHPILYMSHGSTREEAMDRARSYWGGKFRPCFGVRVYLRNK